MKVPTAYILFLELPLLGSAFSPSGWTTLAMSTDPNSHSSALLSSSSSFSSSSSSSSSSYPSEASSQEKFNERDVDQNTRYVKGLMDNLSGLLDKYICSGSPKTRERIINVMDQISNEAVNMDLVNQSLRMVKRAGVPLDQAYVDRVTYELPGNPDATTRQQEAAQRKLWEEQRSTAETGSKVADGLTGRSALSRRELSLSRPDPFMESVMTSDPDALVTFVRDKEDVQQAMVTDSAVETRQLTMVDANGNASTRVAEMIATAGAGTSFLGENLGIGGLDDVLAQVKRRVWIPLAAPPRLLAELGIHPVRGLLLYGKPGCGKTLLARTLANILSPMRPITVVSGPEIMDKFVGSSEKNLREIFDSPPDIYDKYRIGEKDGGDAVARAALHVVVMDEFDAVARTRGGRGGKGEQGDAGVARDSVVNQLLAKMDGVYPLHVPTLVIGLTNKRSLIEPALLRPGRFEVQVEVPPPRSLDQRVSILKVHTKDMYKAGRMLVNDPPPGSTAARVLGTLDAAMLSSYSELLEKIAKECDGYSGAALAGVARAAASHALERAVVEFSEYANGSMMDCLVTKEDFQNAVADVLTSTKNNDYSEAANEEDISDDELSLN